MKSSKTILQKVVIFGLVCGNILACNSAWATAVDVNPSNLDKLGTSSGNSVTVGKTETTAKHTGHADAGWITDESDGWGNVYSGYSGSESVQNNSIIINDGIISGEVYGGYSQTGTADYNSVLITNGTYYATAGTKIYGGYGYSGANNNSVTITNGIFNSATTEIYGGDPGFTSAESNSNNVNVRGGTFNGATNIYGGYVYGKMVGKTNNNNVTVSGGTFCGPTNIYGGYEQGVSGAEANNNIVNVRGGIFNGTTNIYGGSGASGASSGNTLVVGMRDLTVAKVADFQNYIFDLTGVQANDTLLRVTGTLGAADNQANIISGDKLMIDHANKSKLKAGDKITLLDYDGSGALTVDSNAYESTADYIISVDVMNKVITLTALKDLGMSMDDYKAPVEGMAVANAAVNTSTDLVLGAGMSDLITTTSVTVNNTETFGAASYGKSRLNSGSHVDTHGYGIVVGAGKKVFNRQGNKTTGGVFFEYGNSDFDTYNHAVTGTGKSINKGLGYMMRYDHTCGNYYEGMLHGGKVATNWSQNGSTNAYDMNPAYFGGALTYGHKFMVEKEGQLSVYGSYIYTRTGGGDAKIGEHNYSFGATNSHRTRTGVRYAMSDLMDTKKFRPYAGLAWEHEFNGETTATVRGLGEAPAPSMKGDSGILEFGCKQEVGKWTLGVGAELFAGKRRGWNGTLQATYNF